MASADELNVSALVYDYLLKKDASLAKVFQKKTKAVRLLKDSTYILWSIDRNGADAHAVREVPPFGRTTWAKCFRCLIFRISADIKPNYSCLRLFVHC